MYSKMEEKFDVANTEQIHLSRHLEGVQCVGQHQGSS